MRLQFQSHSFNSRHIHQSPHLQCEATPSSTLGCEGSSGSCGKSSRGKFLFTFVLGCALDVQRRFHKLMESR